MMMTSPLAHVRSLPRSLARQKGIGVIEIMLGAIVFIVVVFFLFQLFARGKASIDTVTASTNMTSIAANLQQAFRAQNSYAGLNVAAVVNNRIAPREMIVGGNVVSPWNTNITFAPVAGPGGAANTAARITVPGVDAEQCAAFVNASHGPFYRVVINGTTVKDTSANQTYNTVAAGTACNPNGGTAATIDFFLSR